MQTKQLIHSWLFLLIRLIIKLFYQKQFKITQIKKHPHNSVYVIIFYSKNRQFGVRNAIELYKDIEMLQLFSAKDIAKIGFYAAKTYKIK